MEGEHIVIQKRDSISRYLNYNNTHSIVLLAVTRPERMCLYADYVLIKANNINIMSTENEINFI